MMQPDPAPQQPGPVDVTRGLLIAGTAMGVTAFLLVVKWMLTTLFGPAGAVLLLLAVAGGGGYLWFRSRNPRQAHAVEARAQQLTRSVVTQMSTRYATRAAAPPTQAPMPVPGYPAAPTPPVTGADGLISALLLLPSLLAYGLVYGSATFDSVWQPWWIINGLNLFFVLCVSSRALTAARRTSALLPGLTGLVITGLATSPSPDLSLMSIFSTRQSSGGYSYEAPPTDLLPWLQRAPLLCILLFVIAWGIARREGSWAAGLIPAGLVLWWSIWYRENEFTGEAGWIGVWGLSVGVFIAGCLACWAVDAMTRPRTHPQPLPYPT